MESRGAVGQPPAVNGPGVEGPLQGFTLLEILISAALLTVVVATSFVLLASTRQLTQKPSHHTEAFYFAGETLETLKDYVTGNASSSNYRLAGDGGHYALDYAVLSHVHELPTGGAQGFFRDTLGGTRTYTVEDVDVSSDFDSDGDSVRTNDADYTKVTVTVQWQEQE